MKTASRPTQLERLRMNLIREAVDEHAQHPQYDGHFDNYTLGYLTKDIRTKRGWIGEVDQAVIFTDKGGVTADGRTYVTVYLDGCDTRVDARYVKEWK